MRKTLPHKGIVLRSHACLVETQRNKQECFVWGGNQMNDHLCDVAVLPTTSHSLWPSRPSPFFPSRPAESSNAATLESLSRDHRSTESQHLRMLNA